MNNIKKISIILLNFLSVLTFGQNSNGEWIKSSSFCIGSKYGTTEIWGRPKSIEARHFNEMLPAFFSRRLNFGESDLQNDKLQWVFTGEQGGITIELSKDSLSILQRYYDSFGFTPFVGTDWTVTRANPYPAKQVFQQKIALNGKAKSIAISTTHDFKVAKIITHDLLQVYIEDELVFMDRKEPTANSKDSFKSKLIWTDNKIAAIELIYALHSIKCINSGNIEISEIANAFTLFDFAFE